MGLGDQFKATMEPGYQKTVVLSPFIGQPGEKGISAKLSANHSGTLVDFVSTHLNFNCLRIGIWKAHWYQYWQQSSSGIILFFRYRSLEFF